MGQASRRGQRGQAGGQAPAAAAASETWEHAFSHSQSPLPKLVAALVQGLG